MPGLFDFPLEQLYHYGGTNPCPKDFDSFWDTSISSLNQIDDSVTFTPAPFNVSPYSTHFDCSFKSVNNGLIRAKYLKPLPQNDTHVALIVFHGYGWHSGDWFNKLPYAAAGMHVFALEVRGQGIGSHDGGAFRGDTSLGHLLRGIDDDPQNLFFRSVFLDCARMVKIAKKTEGVDTAKIYTMGLSQGGALALVAAALEPTVAKVAAQYPFLSDYKRVYDMDLARDSYLDLKSYFRKFDPLHEREIEFFTKLGYIDIQFLCSRIKANVLFAVGLSDTVCPPSAQFAAYNKITSLKKMLVYPDFGHEELPGYSDAAFAFLMQK